MVISCTIKVALLMPVNVYIFRTVFKTGANVFNSDVCVQYLSQKCFCVYGLNFEVNF